MRNKRRRWKVEHAGGRPICVVPRGEGKFAQFSLRVYNGPLMV